jgi:hypothetical protein
MVQVGLIALGLIRDVGHKRLDEFHQRGHSRFFDERGTDRYPRVNP